MLKRIKILLNSKDVKTLVENFIALFSLQMIGMLLPLFTLPYVLRTIGFSNYGVIVLANSLIAYFYSLTDFSFAITATRDVSIFRDSPRKLNIIYSKVLIIKTGLLLLSCAIITIVIFLYPPFYKERTVFFLSMLMLLGYTVFPEWFFQGIEKMKYITFLNLGIKIFFAACVFLFIHSEKDYWIYPLLSSAGYIGAGLVGQWILVKKYNLKFVSIKPMAIKQTMLSNYPIFVNQFLPTLYNNTSTFLLGLFTSTALVGVYDAIKKIIDLCITILGLVSRVFFPFLNRKKDSFRFYKKLMLFLGGVFSLLPIIFYKIIFWYLHIEHKQALWVLIILSLGIFFIALYDIYGLNYFIVNRKDKLIMRNTILASVVGFVLAFPLIHFFGIIGAALNLGTSRGIMGVGLNLKYIKYKKNENSRISN